MFIYKSLSLLASFFLPWIFSGCIAVCEFLNVVPFLVLRMINHPLLLPALWGVCGCPVSRISTVHIQLRASRKIETLHLFTDACVPTELRNSGIYLDASVR